VCPIDPLSVGPAPGRRDKHFHHGQTPEKHDDGKHNTASRPTWIPILRRDLWPTGKVEGHFLVRLRSRGTRRKSGNTGGATVVVLTTGIQLSVVGKTPVGLEPDSPPLLHSPR
jgi:hypothetical protein